MACFVATVSLTYRLKGQTGAGTTVTRTGACLAAPFSTELDRLADGFFLVYNGGRQLLESGWTNYDLLSSSIILQTPCTGCIIPAAVPHDCINGACIPASKYSTPGLYPTIEDCEISCGGNGCNGVCVGRSDWAQIKGLADQLRSKECG